MTGVFLCAREAARQMLPAGGGSIINISSMWGHVGGGFSANLSYHATTGAVLTRTRAIAVEWGTPGIRVHAIAPALLRTALPRPLSHVSALVGRSPHQPPPRPHPSPPCGRRWPTGRAARRTDAARPHRRAERPGRRAAVPGQSGLGLRHRPQPAGGRRLDRTVSVVPIASGARSPAGARPSGKVLVLLPDMGHVNRVDRRSDYMGRRDSHNATTRYSNQKSASSNARDTGPSSGRGKVCRAV